MIRDVSPQAVFSHAAHSIVVYTGCSCLPLTNHFTARPLPVKPAPMRGRGPWSAFLGTMSVVSRRIGFMMSVSVLCAEKQNTFLNLLLFSLVTVTSFSRNHFTACQLQFTKGIISSKRFSAHLDSMLGTWVNITAMISGLPPTAASCNQFHPPFFILSSLNL